MENFKDYIEGKPQPTLKAIAEVLNVPQQRLYSVAKQPVAGAVYDARVYNWDALSRFIAKRIGKEGDEFATVEELYNAAMAHDEVLVSQDKRRGPRASSNSKIDLGNGKKMPTRRTEVEVGQTVYLKGHSGEYEVVYLTATHVVMQLKETDLLTCMSNWTFNTKVAKEPAIVCDDSTDTAMSGDVEA